MARLSGKVAIVTGAGFGQGKSTALRLAREASGGGSTINWSSVGGLISSPETGAYGAYGASSSAHWPPSRRGGEPFATGMLNPVHVSSSVSAAAEAADA